jgi:hypothetical protein
MNDLLDLHPGRWVLHIIPPSRMELMLTEAAHHAYHGPLFIFDYGRQYNATVIGETVEGNVEIANRIQTRFAFICSQAVKLLQTTPASKTPIVILDFLSPFYDDSAKPNLLRFFLENAIQNLNRLCKKAGLAVVVFQPSPALDTLHLFDRLKHVAPKVAPYEVPPPPYQQGSLF